MAWTKSSSQDFSEDHRGWPKGKGRKWTKADEQRIKAIHRQLREDPHQFYIGATAVEQEWRKRHEEIPPPPFRTIGHMLANLGLSNKRRTDRHKGAARYLCYPEYTIYHLLGGRVLEVDFIGKKYITGRTDPLNFIAFSFKKEPRLRYFKRIEGQTTENFEQESERFFERFETPHFMKVDNALTFIGSASGKRNISKAMKFLWKRQIIPIFAVPRKPFSQASIEGNNSVFARKFWNQIQFQSIQEVDEKLEWFNLSSRRYTRYQPPAHKKECKKNFIPQAYFIRQVKEDQTRTGKAYIDVLNEYIPLPSSYIHYFVLAAWNVKEEQLSIYFEKEQQSQMIKKLSFPINPTSKKSVLVSFCQ